MQQEDEPGQGVSHHNGACECSNEAEEGQRVLVRQHEQEHEAEEPARTQGRGLRVEGRGWKVEGGGWRVEGGGWRVEGKGWRVEGRGWRVEGRGLYERSGSHMQAVYVVSAESNKSEQGKLAFVSQQDLRLL